MTSSDNLICNSCGLQMQPEKKTLVYLGRHFHVNLPACPSCGRVYLSEELARGKVADVERELEDK